MNQRRLLVVGLLYAGLIVAGWQTGDWFAERAAIDVRPSNEPEINRMVLTATGIYIAASAAPFVPGAEIGLALILALGARIAFLVYGAMVIALLLAFLVGRLVPPKATAAIFDFVGLRKANALVVRLAPLGSDERLALLMAQAPIRAIPFLLRHRYLALAIILNLPGNTLVGGGGGIALAAGMSGLFPILPYTLTVALAVAPLPLVILFTGYLPGG